MSRKQTRATNQEDALAESDRWDELTIEELVDGSEPIEDLVIRDRRPPKQAISMRVDADLIVATKRIATRLGVGYQTLFHIWLSEGVSRFLREEASTPRSRRT